MVLQSLLFYAFLCFKRGGLRRVFTQFILGRVILEKKMAVDVAESCELHYL